MYYWTLKYIYTISIHESHKLINIFYFFLIRWRFQKKNKKKSHNRSLSKEKKYTNVQEKGKLYESNSKQKKTHENEDTHKSITKRGNRYIVNY